MYVERLLQINVATLAALATLLLGAGQHSPIMPLGMMAAAMLSVWLTDFTGWFALGRTVAGAASIGALGVSFPWSLRWDALNVDRKMLLVVGVAHFLVYVQAIHLFRRKTPRIYWALIRFSVLQVVVAALLVQGAFFAVLLVVYLFTALSALALLFLHSERLRHPGTVVPAAARSVGRWPLAGQAAEFASPVPGRLAVQREFFRRLLRIGAGTLVLTIPVFFVVPRIGHGVWRGAGFRPLQAVGYSGKVRLGHLGTVLQNPEEVLRLRLYDQASNKPYRADGEIYLRGALLTTYSRGEWSKPSTPQESYPDPFARQAFRTDRPLVRQKIRIEPMTRDDLFCVWPFASAEPGKPDGLAFDRQTGRLSREEDYVQERFEFELGTIAFANGEQSPLYPAWENPADADVRALLQMPDEGRRGAEEKGRKGEGEKGFAASSPLLFSSSPLLPFSSPSLPHLADLATRWLAGVPSAAANRYGRARYLEGRFRDSGQFTYSLEGQQRDPAIDPIEDFVINNPRGHCEYFATALALMLRSQAIPARIVIGYRTGEWIDSAGFFQVRQLHAHTWVEAYLRQEDLASGPAQDPAWAKGAWLRLDPTPAAGADSLDPWRHALTGAMGWLDSFWGHYVVDMDRPTQREAIYVPLAETIKDLTSTLTSLDWWRQHLGNLWRALGLDRSDPESPASILESLAVAALAAVLILLSGYAVYRVVLVRLLRLILGRPGRVGRRARVQVEFYRRLEALLTRCGLVRGPSQTQREFAVWAGRELAQRTGDHGLALLPVQVAEAFYRVRFGGAALDKPQGEAVEQALGRLEQAARGKKA